MHWGIKVAVQTEHVQGLVVFVLIDALSRYFNDSVNDLRAIFPYGEFQIIHHRRSS
jgi:hypothetical protein